LWRGGKGGAAGTGLGIAGGMYYGSQQNAKGGGDGAQLAFGSDKCPVSSNAFHCSPSTSSPCDPDARSRRPSHASAGVVSGVRVGIAEVVSGNRNFSDDIVFRVGDFDAEPLGRRVVILDMV